MAMGVDEGKQVSGGAFAVIALIIVIAVVMGFIIYALSQFTKSQSRMSQTIGALDAAQFSAYDNKTITGDQVMSAVRTYINQNIVLVVDNQNSDVDFFTGAGSADTLALNTNGANFTTIAPYNIGLHAATTESDTAQLEYDTTDGHVYVGKKPSGTENIMMSTTRNTNIRPLVTKVIDGNPSALYVEAGASYYAVLLYEPSTRTVNGIAFIRSTDA